MDELIQVRYRIQAKLRRIDKFNQDYDPKKESTSDIKVRLSLLSELWIEFDKVQCTIERSCKEKDLDEQTAEQEKFEDKFLSVKAKLLSLLENNSVTSVIPPAPIVSDTKVLASQIKLPHIDLPTFDGNYLGWSSFYDLFESVVNNNVSLSPVQKLHYLKSCLRGDASRLLNSVTTTNDNYSEALEILKDRYANKRQIVYSHLKSLFSQFKLQTESANDLRKLIEVTVENVRGLHVLGLPTDKWDCLLVFMVIERVDSDTRRQWELTTSETEMPTFTQLKQFLEIRCRALEAAEAGKGKLTSNKTSQQVRQSRNNPIAHHVAKISCEKCNGEHFLYKCKQFIELAVKDRVEFIKANSLCYNCLRAGHYTQQCKSSRCRKCNKSHNSLLHYEVPVPIPVVTLFNTDKLDSQVLLATAIVKIQDSLGQYQLCRVLLDSGSQASFVSEACVQRLGIKRKKAHININGLAQSGAGVSKGVVLLRLTSVDTKSSYCLETLVLHKVTGQLPFHHIDHKTWSHLRNLRLADPTFYQPGEIDVLIGADLWPELILSGKIVGPGGTPIAQNTTLGWVLSGRIQTCVRAPALNVHHVDLNEQLRQFWELEEIPYQHHLNAGEEECERHFAATHSRNETGRFVVRLPFRDNIILGDSSGIAKKRLLQVEKRLTGQADKKQMYVDFMAEYLSLGHMEQVHDGGHQPLYHLPHHAVIKESSSTTKLRVVFDGTARPADGSSLNEKLLVGPTVQEDLLTILLRFRMHNIGFAADINKMYRQVLVHPDDRDHQRIFWRSSVCEPIQEYRLNTVTYGTAAAPYLATRCLQQLAEDGCGEFPLASTILKNDFYVDDLMSGSDTLSEALAVQTQLMELLHSGGFELRKWSSSHPGLLESIPVEFRANYPSLRLEVDDAIKTLGLLWIPSIDCFVFKVFTSPESQSINKRAIVSEVARLFDPLGWVAPVIIRAKLIIQKLWLLGVTWDEILSGHVVAEWNQYKSELPMIETIKLPRRIMQNSRYRNCQLHGFCDASQRAYGAVIFLRSTEDSNVYARLVCAKSKVAPIKQISVPRLELCGAVLLTKLMKRIHRLMSIEISCIHLWTDSMVVLAWLSGHASQWKTFVANRVAEIQQNFPPHHWNHVSSLDNPADCLSRGVSPGQLSGISLWWHGPAWLVQEETSWPRAQRLHQPIALEEQRVTVSSFTAEIMDDNLVARYSTLTRLIRITSYCKRFVDNCRLPSEGRVTGVLSTQELRRALLVWIRYVQSAVFAHEIETCTKGLQLPLRSQLHSFCPFLDADGVLRVGGRLQEATLNYDQKHPILLPGHHVFTSLVIVHEHVANLHAGPQLLLAILRGKYWILRARQEIRHHIHKCVKCFRHRVDTSRQLMGSLPRDRLQPVRTFLRCGVDYAGPIMLRLAKGRGRMKSHKAYICVFVCFVVKALHLELVNDLSTDSFMAALHRFISRRGRPSDIYSDCGTNFVGAHHELDELLRLVSSDSHNKLISQKLTSEGINWHFNPPASPHFGGLWEAGVKSVKFHLRRVVGNSVLTYEEMYTVLTQIEACLNSRPLCPMSSNPDDLAALTPGHFLIGEPMTSIVEPDLTQLKLNRLSRWQLVQRLFQHFWKRWTSEYLSRLQQRPKWTTSTVNLAIGDLVLLRNEGLSPLNWPLARVIDTHPGKDGLVRVVSVKTGTGVFKRPITKCCLLPIDSK